MPASPTLSTTNASCERRRWARGWTLERVLFALAGTVTATSAVLAATVSAWFLLLTGFVATNQLAFAFVGDCGASLILRRLTPITAANDG